ncbi:MAG: hypothetical protein M1813_005952 [Trichoglossum hirsutum]|nr:MAG: hypothetical protein M1813_005952 [Trichoglossum hirsutum]
MQERPPPWDKPWQKLPGPQEVPLTKEPVGEEEGVPEDVVNVVNIRVLDTGVLLDVLEDDTELVLVGPLGCDVLEGEADVELPSNIPMDERYASIPEATLVAAAELNGIAGTQLRSLVFPVVQGATCIVDD